MPSMNFGYAVGSAMILITKSKGHLYGPKQYNAADNWDGPNNQEFDACYQVRSYEFGQDVKILNQDELKHDPSSDNHSCTIPSRNL